MFYRGRLAESIARCAGRAVQQPMVAALLMMSLGGGGVAVRAQTVTYAPVINTVAGGGKGTCTGATDAYGDGCPATQAVLSGNYTSVSDPAGNLYIGDLTHGLIRRVDAKTGIITTIAGGQPICASATNSLGDGCPATQANFATVRGMALDLEGNLVFADSTTSADYRIRIVNLTTGIINTLVGTGAKGTKCPTNSSPLPANQTSLSAPYGTAFDNLGNLYIAQSGLNCVLLVVAINGVIDPNNSLTYTLIGNSVAGHAGIPGPASSGEINQPHAVQTDAAGNVYTFDFADYSASITSSAFSAGMLNLNLPMIANFAGGTYAEGTTGDGGQATQATLGPLQGGLVDAQGNVELVANGVGYDSVRVVNTKTGTITTLAGNGTRSNTGDGGPAVLSTINGPTNANFDRFGRIFIDLSNGNTVRSVSQDNVFPFTSVRSSSAAQNLIATSAGITLQSASISGASTAEFTLGTLSGCATGAALAAGAYCTLPVTFKPSLPGVRTATLTLTDSNNVASPIGLTGYGIAPAVDFSGSAITTIAGTGVSGSGGDGAAATAAKINAPRGGMFDPAGNLYFADSGNNEIRRVDHASGQISIVAGTGVAGTGGDGGAATSAKLSGPAAVYVDPADNLYISDSGNNTIRYVNAATGVISTIAGTGSAGYTGDGGLPTAATLSNPLGITVDPGGFVYVADNGNNVVRRFNVGGGEIATTVGNGTAGYAGDGGPASLSQLSRPSAVAFDLSGNFYIADTGNGVVRVVSDLGIMSTFAGKQGGTTNTGDGGAAVAATLNSPSDLALDAGGDLYIASGNQVRVVNGAGVITSVAGAATAGPYSGDGPDATKVSLPSPASNLFLDGSGNVYIAATAANSILAVASATPRTLAFGAQSTSGTSGAQSLVVTNTGNSALTFTAVTLPADYALNTASPTECAANLTLAAGGTCSLDVTFSPKVNGSDNGAIVLSDNALNNTAATQSIALTGTGSSVTPTTTMVVVTPSPLVYGTAASATVTVTGGNSPSGTVAVTIDNVAKGNGTLVGGTVTIPLGVLNAGAHTIAAAYSGDAFNGSSGSSSPLTVLPSVLTVSATSTSKHQNDPNPALTYTFTGFVNGDTQSVVSGAPVETTTATTTSAQGTYPITLTQGTLAASNYTFIFQPGTLTIGAPLPADFTLGISSQSLSIVAGSVGTLTVSLTPLRGYNGTVTLGCQGLPAYVTCTFNSNSIPMDGVSTLGTTLTVGTIGLQTVAMDRGNDQTRDITLAGLVPLFSVGLLFASRKKRRNLARLLTLLLGIVFVAGLTSCTDAVGSQVASPGSATITISAGDGTLNHTTQVALTVTSK